MYPDLHYFLLDNQYVVESAESLLSQLGIVKNVYCAETKQINLINKKKLKEGCLLYNRGGPPRFHAVEVLIPAK